MIKTFKEFVNEGKVDEAFDYDANDYDLQHPDPNRRSTAQKRRKKEIAASERKLHLSKKWK